jgi:predicted nuclease of predicted toxin-antitoxin system
MKLLVDAHVSKIIIEMLVKRGHDVLKASSFPPKTPDAVLLAAAADQDRVVMTSDKDFGEMVFRQKKPAAGVVLLRIDVKHEADRLAVVERFWSQIEAAAPKHFVVVTSRTVGRTPLPPSP